MNASWDEDNRFIVSKFGDFLVTEGHALGDFETLPSFMGGYDQHIYNPLLITFCQLVSSKEKLSIPLIISLQFQQIFPALLVGIRIDKCKFHASNKLIKQEIKPKN